MQQVLALDGGQVVAARREQLDVRAQARERRAQLVRGILDEASLQARGLVERLEHRVEGRGEARELVAPLDADALRQVARRAHALRGGRELAHGRERRARNEEAGDRGDADAAERDENQPELDLRQLVIDVFQRRDDLDRRVARIERRDEEAHVLAFVMRFEVERVLLPRRDSLRLGHARQQRRDVVEPLLGPVGRSRCVDDLERIRAQRQAAEMEDVLLRPAGDLRREAEAG